MLLPVAFECVEDDLGGFEGADAAGCLGVADGDGAVGVGGGDAAAGGQLAALEESEVGAIFRELAAGLSERQRLVFLLREIEGLSSQEVAAIAGCEESTVRNHLFNARKVLRRELVRRYPEYAAGRQERREEAR